MCCFENIKLRNYLIQILNSSPSYTSAYTYRKNNRILDLNYHNMVIFRKGKLKIYLSN